MPRPNYISFLVASAEEKEHFDWFQQRTGNKLRGSFFSEFWSTLILQSSLSESAVFHAVLALSSVHWRGSLNSAGQVYNNEITDRAERVTLQQYAKAISSLRPHLSANNERSLRVVLIACIVFISLDLLRGHFTSAQIHLKNGYNLFKRLQSLSKRENELSGHLSETADDWIMEAFMRLHSSAELFRLINRHPCQALLHESTSVPSTRIFGSLKEAWEHLDRLLDQIIHLNNKAREYEASCITPRPSPPALRASQRLLQTGLSHWLDIYKASQPTFRERDMILPSILEKCLRVIELHHHMLAIMNDVSLSPNDEGIYDIHTDKFVQLINKAAGLWAYSFTTFADEPQPAPNQFTEMARSIIDKGSISPLYFVAVKCRVHRIRLQAVRLAESLPHREGFWDSDIMAKVMRKVVETEEKDYYENIDPLDNVFSLSSAPTSWDLSLPTLPVSYRLRNVEVILSGSPVDRVLLLSRNQEGERDQRVQIGEYDIYTQHWMDEVDFSSSDV